MEKHHNKYLIDYFINIMLQTTFYFELMNVTRSYVLKRKARRLLSNDASLLRHAKYHYEKLRSMYKYHSVV